MIVLHELVEHVLTDIGHLLVPIDVFGFTYPRLEKLMITTLNKYQEYRPLYRKVPMPLTGITLIPDAQRVYSIRPYSTSWEYSYPMDFKDWEWDDVSKELSVTTTGDYMVQYLGKYTIEQGTSLSYTSDELFPEETSTVLPLLGHFKKGTLNIFLDEGTIDPEPFTVDATMDTFIISNSSTLYNKMLNGTIVSITSTGVIPSPLSSGYEYYVIERNNGNLQLALTYEDANIAPKSFTTNFMLNPTYLTITNHGLSNNQPVQLETTDTFPSPLLGNTTYYVNVINANTIELKTTPVSSAISLFSNGLGSHTLHTGFIDLSSIGTGIHTMSKVPYSMSEDIGSYTVNGDYITLSGTLGNAILSLTATDVSVPNQTELFSLNPLEMYLYDIKANFTDPSNLIISFNSQYKTIKELSLEDNLYVNLFKGELMKGLGTSKAITRLDGLPFDVSVDDLYSKGDELVQKTLEDLMNSRSKWSKFR